MSRIAVIGAGLAGLTVANALKSKAAVTVFEKARGIGGRMSNRRSEPWHFDHGAQYFTARTAAFQQLLQAYIDNGTVSVWPARYRKYDALSADGEYLQSSLNWADDEPRYVASPGMNALVKQLALDTPVTLSTRVSSLQRSGGKWLVETEDGSEHAAFDWVISSAPAPQTAALLPADCSFYAAVSALQMQPCFSLMLGFGNATAPAFDAAHISNADIAWLAVNSSKPGRPAACSVLVHSSSAYAAANADTEREAVIAHLCAEVERICAIDTRQAEHRGLHLWRYANVSSRDVSPVFLDHELQLAACGDWCAGGRVEGAFSSAQALSARLLAAL